MEEVAAIFGDQGTLHWAHERSRLCLVSIPRSNVLANATESAVEDSALEHGENVFPEHGEKSGVYTTEKRE